MLRLLPAALASWVALLGWSGSSPGAIADDDRVSFEREIRPILSDACVFCHGPDANHREAGLRLDRREEAVADRGGYAAIVPGDPESSELMLRVCSEDELDRMPPPDSGKELSPEQVELLRRWIEQGAEFEEHWSFVPPTRPEVPEVGESSWPLGAVDRFLLAEMERHGLSPAAEVDRGTLIRRLALDLTGIPPTIEELEAFERDDRPGAEDRLIDRLLASPRYGERMAILWLDLVRYADTVGYHGDQEHHISPYRDYVIAAFNRNLPFDRFTVEQLAGDLLPEPTIDQLVASGYNRLLQTTHEGGAQDKEYLAKYAADRVRNLSGAWLGATMGCAECHDHKYDPYTQADFYRLAAFFADLKQRGAYPGPDVSPTPREPEIEVLDEVDRRELAEVEEAIAALGDRPGSEPEREALERKREEIASRARRTMVSVSVEPRITRILPRGNWMDESGPVVEPGVPGVLPELGVEGRRASRLDLARWLTRPDHPMTSRVFVNRLWDRFFGRGLSRSLDDTGVQGQAPSHPELLDWLAVEFVESGWDVKHLVRLMVSSRAYRQSSIPTPERLREDPDNEWFARQGRFRLPAELIRDQALAVSGLLVERLGGRSARPDQPEGYYAFLNFPKRTYVPDSDGSQYRRGVYMHWQRQFLHPMLRAFDAPTREECTAKRSQSNTPIGALTLLNDPCFVEAARAFAGRVLLEVEGTDADRIAWAWRSALSRSPTVREVEALVRLLERERSDSGADPSAASALLGTGLAPVPEGIDPAELAAWTAVTRAILNLHETITRL
ncbi:DUF1553 domain-containing protein [Tautonia sociabilis]|uniref:DUF1553 domain-containing protein n=2 Tax=Tautonia sociabilis TaxID=2080755 RepID=A0A432MH81_9BACT|nr:DUF1553 domain-containing protein [Tautonia sociabilis]